MKQPPADDGPGISGRGIQSIEVGARLLRVLVNTGRPMKLRDLANAAGLTPGQAHAYLVSFRKIELVVQDKDTGLYRVGPFALQLGLARLRNHDPLRTATREVPALCADLDLMVAISVWGNYGPTIVRVDEASHQVHANVRVGAIFSVSGTATGRVFGAYMPRKIVDPVIRAELREATRQWAIGEKPTFAGVQKAIRETRKAGYAVTIGRPVPGISAVSAPVFDFSGHLQLAVTIIGPSEIVDCSPDSVQVAALLGLSGRISRNLGHVAEAGAAAS